jgi:hypothetical protein
MKDYIRYILVTFSSLIFVLTTVYAWTGPSVTPPGDNVDAPITVGIDDQEKLGGLWLASLAVSGKAISTSTVSTDAGNTLVTKDYIEDAGKLGANQLCLNGICINSWDEIGALDAPIIQVYSWESDSAPQGGYNGAPPCGWNYFHYGCSTSDTSGSSCFANTALAGTCRLGVDCPSWIQTDGSGSTYVGSYGACGL